MAWQRATKSKDKCNAYNFHIGQVRVVMLLYTSQRMRDIFLTSRARNASSMVYGEETKGYRLEKSTILYSHDVKFNKN